MRSLIIQEWISLDGFATDKQNKLDFFAHTVRDVYNDEYYARCLATIDCILFGRNTYDQFAALWPERTSDLISEKMNLSKKIVFSKSLQTAPWGSWEPVTIEAGDIKSKIQELKSLPGRNIIIWGSLSIAQLAIKERLVDEYHLHICPTITGGGRQLFVEGSPLSLKLLHSKQLQNGVVSLHYKT